MDSNPSAPTVPPIPPQNPVEVTTPSPAPVTPQTPPQIPAAPQHRFSLPMLIISVVVLIVLVGGFLAYRMFLAPQKTPATKQETTDQTRTVDTSKQMVQATPNPDDISGVDSNLSSVDSALNSVDSGLNDQPVNLN